MLIAWRSRSMPLQTDSPMPDNHFLSMIGRSSWSRFARSSVNPMRLLVRIGSASSSLSRADSGSPTRYKGVTPWELLFLVRR